MLKTASHNPFRLLHYNSNSFSYKVAMHLLRPFSLLLGLEQCAELYSGLPLRGRVSGFAEHALAKLGVGWSVDGQKLNAFPKSGATIVVANHPFGGLEGLILLAMLQKIRPDVKIFANPILSRIPEMGHYVIPLNPFDNKTSRKKNVASLRKAYDWLDQDGLLVVFPAGEVSHFQMRSREVTDPLWQQGVGRLVRKSGAAVVPVFFNGRNGFGFQLAGIIHPRLRTLLLPRQLVNKNGQMLDVKVGDVIPQSRLKSYATAEELTAYLRFRTYLLAHTNEKNPLDKGVQKEAEKELKPISEPVKAVDLAREVNHLPKSCLLHEQGKNQVWCVEADQAPKVIQELGRLRELTFRQHDEGTGNSIDLDRFDEYYLHLFVWNDNTSEIVGAYRIGRTDEIIRSHGVAGLYTNSLFRYHKNLFQRVGPALELGRSFVRPEYQKSFSSLLLLWQGIGRFLVKNPRYRFLFGPVSISQSYSDFSRQLMTSTLNEQLRLEGLSRFVAPRLPVVVRKPKVKGCSNKLTKAFSSDLNSIDSLLAEIEADGKGLPVLLRHYLNLGGRMLAFNLDPDFRNVIDGLVMVELEKTPQKTLSRYLGKKGLEKYLGYTASVHYADVA